MIIVLHRRWPPISQKRLLAVLNTFDHNVRHFDNGIVYHFPDGEKFAITKDGKHYRAPNLSNDPFKHPALHARKKACR